MNNSNAYDDFHNSRKIKEDYTEVLKYLNGAVFTAEDQSAEGFIFFAGNEFCKDLPDFYPYCQCFWEAYTEFYLGGIKYFLETHSIKSDGTRFKKIKEFTNNINNHFDISADLRQDIFIEYNHQIDAKIDADFKSNSKSGRSKKSNLKPI